MVVSLARRLGLANTPFSRHLPDIANRIRERPHAIADLRHPRPLSHGRLERRYAEAVRDNRNLRDSSTSPLPTFNGSP